MFYGVVFGMLITLIVILINFFLDTGIGTVSTLTIVSVSRNGPEKNGN